MKNILAALAALAAVALLASSAAAGTPKGVLNPDGSITYTITGNDDIPKSPVPLAAVEIGNTGVGSYEWQALTWTPGLAVGDEYLISWDCTWNLEVSAQGQYLADVGGYFAGHHGGTSYSGNPEPVLRFTPSAATAEVPRRLRNLFVGKGDVGLEWQFSNSNTISAWSESTGYVGVGVAFNALDIQFQVTYYPVTL